MMTSVYPPLLEGLGASPYDGFILDLWGVVHDGVAPFPDAVIALSQIKAAGKKAWLLSNAPRRLDVVSARLTQMGIGADLYDGLMTSGEASYQALAGGLVKSWGQRCLHLGAAHNDSLFQGLNLRLAAKPEEADFILNSGVVSFADDTAQYEPLLEACARRDLPMLCANPDMVVHVGSALVVCAGTTSEMYEKLGGRVTYFGKPYKDVYDRVLAGMKGASRILAVGDSMVTDIRGANEMGLDSALVVSGIHREEYADIEKENFLDNYAFRPTYLMKHLFW